jgi:hypothetical protein
MEELDQDMNLEKRAPSRGGKSARGNSGQGSKACSTPTGSKKVMDWVSLFQEREETMTMENSELTQYSCSILLREMETLVSDLEEDGIDMMHGDDELVRFPEQWIQENFGPDKELGLPENLFEIPGANCGSEMLLEIREGGKDEGYAKKGPNLSGVLF